MRTGALLAIGGLLVAAQIVHAATPSVGAGDTHSVAIHADGTTANYQDLWWASPTGSESGWGLDIAHQGDVLFATWFTYDAGNKGLWLVMSDGAKTGTGTYAGTLQRTTGPVFSTGQGVPSQVTRSTVGTAALTFSDASNGVFRYLVNGISQSKPITRLVHSTPATVCR